MRVLVTGGFGWLGSAVVRAARARGHRVRCLELPTLAHRLRARRLPSDVEVAWGDIRDAAALDRAVAGQEVVVHAAAVLYPLTELRPALARSVNVDGTRALLAAMARCPARPGIVYPSSVTVYGPGRHRVPPLAVTAPLCPTDHYSHHKVAGEEMVRDSGLRWSILRVGVSLDPARPRLHPLVLRTLLDVSPSCRLEYVHPDDVGAAIAAALDQPAAWNRELNIGGGPACRVYLRDIFGAFFGAVGLDAPPDTAFGTGSYYTDWLDTTDSQQLLGYQRHTFLDFRAENRKALRLLRWALLPARPVVQPVVERLLCARQRPRPTR